VLVAHELGPLAPLVSRAVLMRDGRIVRDGPPLADHGVPHAHHHEHDILPHDHGHAVRLSSPIEGGQR
jgi:zinc transport system ATP-binding protein